jgi:hypothetical protein
MFQIKQIFDKYYEETTRFQYKNLYPISILNLYAENMKTTFRFDFEDDFISKNIQYYIAGKINLVDSTKSYNKKCNIKMVENFVGHKVIYLLK